MLSVLKIVLLLALQCKLTHGRQILSRILNSIGRGSSCLLLFHSTICFAADITRLQPCPTEGNCISTASVRSIEHYARPWELPESVTVEQAWTSLKNELASNKLFKVVDTRDEDKYVRAEAKSAVPPTGIDDVEFLILSADRLVTFRSNSREVVRAGGVVGDGGSHANRLQTIRNHLKLREMGAYDENELMVEQEQTSFFGKLKSGFGYTSNKPADINFLDNSVPTQDAESLPAVAP